MAAACGAAAEGGGGGGPLAQQRLFSAYVHVGTNEEGFTGARAGPGIGYRVGQGLQHGEAICGAGSVRRARACFLLAVLRAWTGCQGRHRPARPRPGCARALPARSVMAAGLRGPPPSTGRRWRELSSAGIRSPP